MSEREDENVINALASLERVEAPADFNTRVRSRINSREAERRSGPIWPRFAVPAVALAVTIGVLAFGLYLGSGLEQVQVVVEPAQREHTEAAGNDRTPVEPERSAAQPRDSLASETGPAPNNSTPRTTLNRRVEDRIPPSEDQALNAAPDPLRPSGFNTNPGSSEPQNDYGTKREVPVRTILNIIGISGDQKDGQWTANSVRVNSAADLAGVKPGDIIETLNNIPITGKDALAGGVSMKSIGIRRGSQRLSLNFR